MPRLTSRSTHSRTARLLSSLSLFALACSGAAGDESAAAEDGELPGLEDGDAEHGADLYQQMCAACHGMIGEGGVGPPLAGWSRPAEELISIIDAEMPTQNPAICTGNCPADIAAYILDNFGVSSCEDTTAGPRQLRLLTRREYDATVRDLLRLTEAGPTDTGMPCMADTDCTLASESCEGDTCVVDSCGRHTFVFDPGGQVYGSVHVAGSFNDWPGSVAEGGWALSYDAGAALWYGKFDLPEGSHLYKFVLDESEWISDPENPDGVDDSFGGLNSVLDINCNEDGAGNDFDPARNFPVESRPEGFGFDNNAAAGLVTSVHVDQQLLAAKEVASKALEQLELISSCYPATDEDCARSFAEEFGLRAFRRPLSAAEVDKYAGLIMGQGDFDAGIEVALQVMLSSPYFTYRFEIGEADASAGGLARLTPYELAAALSYTFWGTMPDDALFEAARSGALDTPAGIEAEARRLLAHPRARELMATFTAQWLGIEGIATADKNGVNYPQWSPSLAAAMATETRRFVEHVVFDGSGSFDDLLTADYSFANAELGAHYGVDAVSGEAFGQFTLPPQRAGLLGHGSILASYAHSDQSSPVRRGLWVREHLLCQKFGAPPPEAGGVPEVDPNATTRERFEQHSADENCRICHQYIDELGFGFEHFDAIGGWRESDAGKPIDASGSLNDVEGLGTGTSSNFASLPELAALLANSDAVHACFARQSFRFTMGKHESVADLCGIEDLQQRFADAGYDVQELLVTLVTSPMFLYRQ